MLDTNYQNALLAHSMLSSLACSLPTMDPRKVRSMGITPEQAMWISRLSTADMMRLASSGTNCLHIQVDSEALDDLIASIDEEGDRSTLMIDCIRRDASREMMTEMFDITPRHYTRLRQQCGLPPAVGRPKECSQQDAERICDAWRAEGSAIDPKVLLSIADELDLPLRVIWSEIGEYDANEFGCRAPSAELEASRVA